MSRILHRREVGGRDAAQNRASFFLRYAKLCRLKNAKPLKIFDANKGATPALEFHGDRLTVPDWLLFAEALGCDRELETLGVLMRKPAGIVMDHVDTEKKALALKSQPSIYAKFVFGGVVEAIAQCISASKTLFILKLENLPLHGEYAERIAQALSANDSIGELSFQDSNLQDEGCELICNAIKCLENIVLLNLSACQLTDEGGRSVANLIKVQKVNRYAQSWQKSLRYGDIEPDTFTGLRSIFLARNPNMGDDSMQYLMDVLRDDVWIKFIDMGGCDLTDRAADLLIDCLGENKSLGFNVSKNPKLKKSIYPLLGSEKERAEQEALEKQRDTAVLMSRVRQVQRQLAFERTLLEKANLLNGKLNRQVRALEGKLMFQYWNNLSPDEIIVKKKTLQAARDACYALRRLTNKDLRRRTRQCIPPAAAAALAAAIATGATTSSAVPTPAPPKAAVKRRQLPKDRQVKSETKFAEKPMKNARKPKESKSEGESVEQKSCWSAVHFEMNIGDAEEVIVKPTNSSKSSTLHSGQFSEEQSMQRRTIDEVDSDIEIDLQSVTSGDADGVLSSGSDTLRGDTPPEGNQSLQQGCQLQSNELSAHECDEEQQQQLPEKQDRQPKPTQSCRHPNVRGQGRRPEANAQNLSPLMH